MIIAIDFDGTVVYHEFPNVGPDAPGAVETLKDLVAAGHKLILWTMRSGDSLTEAIEWFEEREIPLYGIQTNPTQAKWTSSPKAYAELYIDDAALGAPLVKHKDHQRPVINWKKVRATLLNETAPISKKDLEHG